MSATVTAARSPRLQALIDEVKAGPAQGPRNTDNVIIIDQPRMLDTIDEFMDVANSAIRSMTLVDSQLADARRRGCRTHVAVWKPHAEGFIGKVTNGRFYAIIRAQLQSMISDLSIRQYNGDWRLAHAEISTFFQDILERSTANAADRSLDEFRQTARKRTTRFLLLACEFVDLKGGEEARFRADDGMPSEDLHSTVPTANADVRALLELAQQADRQRQAEREEAIASGEAEKIAALQGDNDTLRQEVAQLRALFERMIAGNFGDASSSAPGPASGETSSFAPTPAKPAPKKRRSSSRKKTPPTNDGIDDTLQGLEAQRSRSGAE